MKRYLVLCLIILSLIQLSHSLDLAIINPSERLYNVTSYVDDEGNLKPLPSISLAVDYINNFHDKDKTFMQVDNEIYKISNDGMISILDGSTNGNILIPTPIKNNIHYILSSASNPKNFSVRLSDYVGIFHYDNKSEYKGWYCIDDSHLKQINNLSLSKIEINLTADGLYYTKYVISSNDYKEECTIPYGSMKYVSLIEVENISITHRLEAGYLSYNFTPGDHHLILFSYNDDGSIYNATKDFFVVINECGDLKCDDGEECPYDCKLVEGSYNINDDVVVPESAKLILAIDSKNIRKERGKNYLVFDLSKEQYEIKMSITPTKDGNFYIEDYDRKNMSDLLSYNLDGSIIGNDVIKLEANRKYPLIIKVDKLKPFHIGDNYGVIDLGGIMQLNYKVVMPRDLYSRIRIKPVTDSRLKIALDNNKGKIITLMLLLVVILLIIYYRKIRIRRTMNKIKLKYGVDIGDL